MTQLTEAYVIGLLSDVEESAPRLRAQLVAAKQKAAAVDAELGNLLRRLDASRAALRESQSQVGRSGAQINDGNMRIAALHQEIALFKRKADDIKTEMGRVVDEPAIRRKLRRERAKLAVQIEEREEEIAAVRREVERERQVLAEAEQTQHTERDRSRLLTLELDKLQALLPSPYLYGDLFGSLAARAHCRLFLDADVEAWKEELREAIDVAHELHRELRAGKYRLDKNSELVGGRAMMTAEAIYGAVALGERDLGLEIFEVATDPGLYFHQIFNVFRVWALGLYLSGRSTRLRELLRHHQYAQGLRGGYVQAFIGLLTGEQRRVAIGLRDVTRHEWEQWQDPSLVRGAGVVNLGALALTRLARESGVPVEVPGPTVPTQVIGDATPRRLAARTPAG